KWSGRVHNHVTPFFYRTLIQRAPGKYLWIAAHRAARGWHRVARIVYESVRLRMWIRFSAQFAIVAKVKLRVAGSRERPLVFVTPLIGAHHKDTDRMPR